MLASIGKFKTDLRPTASSFVLQFSFRTYQEADVAIGGRISGTNWFEFLSATAFSPQSSIS
jgi:hypothetical protein